MLCVCRTQLTYPQFPACMISYQRVSSISDKLRLLPYVPSFLRACGMHLWCTQAWLQLPWRCEGHPLEPLLRLHGITPLPPQHIWQRC